MVKEKAWCHRGAEALFAGERMGERAACQVFTRKVFSLKVAREKVKKKKGVKTEDCTR